MTTCANQTIMVRVPNHHQVNFHYLAVDAAVDERNRLCKLEGIDPYNINKGRVHLRNHRDKINNDLPVGISRSIDRRRERLGSPSEGITAYYTTIHGKNKMKRWSYGGIRTEEQAIKLARAFRNKMVEILQTHREQKKDLIRKS